MRSKLLQQVKADIAIAAQTVTLTSGAATIKGAAISHVDDQAALGALKSAIVHLQAGVSGAAALAYTLKIQESDTTTDGDFTDVTLNASLPTLNVTTSAADSDYFYLKTAGLKKYWRVVATAAGTGTDTGLLCASVVQGDGSTESLPRGTIAPTVYVKA